MGLIQEIEGLLGFGKKAATPVADKAAVSNALTTFRTWLEDSKALVTVLTPIAAANPAVAALLGVVQGAITVAEGADSYLEGLLAGPVAPEPVQPIRASSVSASPPTITPAAPPAEEQQPAEPAPEPVTPEPTSPALPSEPTPPTKIE